MTWSPNPNALRGRVAVVAGATRGAGRGIAAALGEAGATVVCTGRSTRAQARRARTTTGQKRLRRLRNLSHGLEAPALRSQSIIDYAGLAAFRDDARELRRVRGALARRGHADCVAAGSSRICRLGVAERCRPGSRCSRGGSRPTPVEPAIRHVGSAGRDVRIRTRSRLEPGRCRYVLTDAADDLTRHRRAWRPTGNLLAVHGRGWPTRDRLVRAIFRCPSFEESS